MDPFHVLPKRGVAMVKRMMVHLTAVATVVAAAAAAAVVVAAESVVAVVDAAAAAAAAAAATMVLGTGKAMAARGIM